MMNLVKLTSIILLAVLLHFSLAQAATANTYQVTGTVKGVTSDMITVDKGGEIFEIARDSSTKMTGEPKVGSKVTVKYRMTAAAISGKESSTSSSTKAADKKLKK